MITQGLISHLLTVEYICFLLKCWLNYFYSLDDEKKKRYMQKLSLFQGQDPYALKKEDLSKCESFLGDFK